MLNSQKIMELLDSYLRQVLTGLNNIQEEDVSNREKVKTWIIKKGRTHPHQVYEIMQEIEQGDEIRTKIKKLGLEEAYAFKIAEIIALLHDTGRLAEVDMASGEFKCFEDKAGYSHELESCKIAQAFGIDDVNILLPIKYHDMFDIEQSLNNDEAFLVLSDLKKQRVLLFAFLIQDADKTANMLQYCETGIKNTSETLDTAYSAKAEVSPLVKQSILAGKIPLKNMEHTYIDALLRFLSLSFVFHFTYSKKVFKEKILDGIFKHVKSEITENATDENQATQALSDAQKIYEFIKDKM